MLKKCIQQFVQFFLRKWHDIKYGDILENDHFSNKDIPAF